MSLRIQHLALALVLGAAVACGGGDDKTPAGGAPAGGGAKAPAPAPAGGGAAAAAGGKYDKAKGTATLKGVVKFKGAIPAPVNYKMDTEPKCAQHGTTAVIEKTEVNADGTLPWVFVYAVEGPSVGQSGYDVPTVEVDQKGCVYQPHVFGAMTKQNVVFLNTDAFSHNVHVKGKKQEWNKSQNAGQKDTYNPDKEFGVKIICDVHSWMNSWMHVMDHPFFAVSTRTGGTFEIKGLYPGKHKFRAWHENWAKEKQVEFEIELKDGENSKEIEITGS